MSSLRAYHKAWLSAHPDRDEAWLQGALAWGFDVHHMDCNHENNDPANLVLIECVDHMRLHDTPLTCHPRITAERAGRKGGKQRAKNLTPAALSRIGKMGAKARWRKKV